MAGVSDVQVDFKMQTVTDVLDGSDDPEVDDHLDVVAVVDGGVEVGDDEVGVVGQPAHQEDGHHSHHHLHHLGFIITTNITIITTIITLATTNITWASITQRDAVRCPPPLSPMMQIYNNFDF